MSLRLLGSPLLNRRQMLRHFANGFGMLALAGLLVSEKAKGKRIACYGAAAKGATMVNYLDLGERFFEFVADANAYKQGK